MTSPHTNRIAAWAQSILKTLGKEPTLTQVGFRMSETPERFLWVAGAEAAAERLMEMVGNAACEDSTYRSFIDGMKANLPVADYNVAAGELAGNAKQLGAKLLRGFVQYAAEIAA